MMKHENNIDLVSFLPHTNSPISPNYSRGDIRGKGGPCLQYHVSLNDDELHNSQHVSSGRVIRFFCTPHVPQCKSMAQLRWWHPQGRLNAYIHTL